MKLRKHINFPNVLLALIIVLSTGCAITTTYGVKPEQDTFNPDVYTFTVYYNAFSNEEDIAKNANKQIAEFIEETEYVDSEVVNVSTQSGRSLYEVRFFKETKQ